MTIGLVGRKSGMTRVFTDEGVSIPVTVVEVSPNRVTQIKELDTDGYRAIQVTAGNRKASKVSKSEAGHFAKAGVEAGNGLWEFRLEDADEAPEVGAELTVERFEVGQKVKISGPTKGRGFQGTVKRHNFGGSSASHGGSATLRKPGSIGQPVDGVEFRLIDEDWNDVAEGEIGEIAIKGHNVMKGYLNKPEATASVMKDGWFRTGDLAKRDADGYYFIVDRAKDMIITGGTNVYPAEIEATLLQHTKVHDAGVIGIPDPDCAGPTASYCDTCNASGSCGTDRRDAAGTDVLRHHRGG